MGKTHMHGKRYSGDVSPTEAWDILTSDDAAMLVDVRTPEEWTYVGIPDLSAIGKKAVFLPWVLFPEMRANPDFARYFDSNNIAKDRTLLFLCRSGVRSAAAAIRMTSEGYRRCFNVASGFEGDCNGEKHRGTLSGWKVDGLPWVQS